MNPKLERQNAHHLYQDIFWMGAAFALDWYFLQVYAIRLGATALDLGLLTSGRALFMVIGSALGNRWLLLFRNPVKALGIPIWVSRVLFLFMPVFIVYLPAESHAQVNALLVLVVLSSVPTGIAQGVFLGMMRKAVSEASLAQVVMRRSILMNATVLFWALVFGQFFEHFAFPGTYQIGFVIAFLTSSLSSWNILRIKTPDRDEKSPSPPTPLPSEWARGEDQDVQHDPQVPLPQTGEGFRVRDSSGARGGGITNVWKNPVFVRFAVIVVAVNMGVFLAAPLIQLYLVRGLGADDGWISFFGMFEMVAGALPMFRMEWLTARFGSRGLVVISAFFIALHTLILALTPILAPYLVAVLLYGAGWWGVNVLLYNRLVELVPHEEFAPYAVAYQLLVNISLFVGPLIGTLLIENGMTIPMALLLISAFRFLACILAWLLGRGTAQSQEPAKQFIEEVV